MVYASLISNACFDKVSGRTLVLAPVGIALRAPMQVQALVPHQSPEQYQAVQFSSLSICVSSEAKAELQALVLISRLPLPAVVVVRVEFVAASAEWVLPSANPPPE
jgi:hypothetical protein